MNLKFSFLLLGLMLFTGCKSPEIVLSGDHKLTKFSVFYNTVEYSGLINDSTNTVNVALPWNTYMADMKCSVAVSPNASYVLSDSIDFSKPQTITITAQNKNSVQYRILVSNSQILSLSDEKIEVKNCLHVSRDSTKIVMLRFNELNLAEPRINYMQNGKTQSGVIVRFKTNSNFVKVKFTETTGARWGTDYGVWADGVWFNNYINHNFTLQKTAGKDFVTWEISPSLMNAVNLTSIEIENGKDLVATQIPAQSQYFAIGNSITQGVGQGNAGYLSYPFLFGRKMSYETYNLGVGGSKVSWKVATELENHHVDLISVMWGYNDWYFVGETAANYKSMMQELLNKIREYQPNTSLVCISLIGTENPTPSSAVTIDAFRNAMAQLVAERIATGDRNIYLLDGAKINVELMDKVHPSVKGASDLADIFANFVKENIH